MTLSKSLLTALAASALLAVAAAPASAVAIRHTNWAEGDPAASSLPTGHATPPVDTRQAHALDKMHDGSGNR